MIDRIKEILRKKNLTPSQFADEIGIQRSGMSHLISGRNKPSLEFVMKVLKRFPDITPEYLLQDEIPFPDLVEPVQPAEKEKKPTLFDEPMPRTPDEPKKVVKQQKTGEKPSERKIEKIVVLYNDRTFREYGPELYS